MIPLCFPKIGVIFKKQIETKLLHPTSTLKSRIQVLLSLLSLKSLVVMNR
ncbi:MAG: hypothetical protein P8X79_14875 [Reinekea sp.]